MRLNLGEHVFTLLNKNFEERNRLYLIPLNYIEPNLLDFLELIDVLRLNPLSSVIL